MYRMPVVLFACERNMTLSRQYLVVTPYSIVETNIKEKDTWILDMRIDAPCRSLKGCGTIKHASSVDIKSPENASADTMQSYKPYIM